MKTKVANAFYIMATIMNAPATLIDGRSKVRHFKEN